MQSKAWIERGPDGHPRYVKQKHPAPSIRRKLAEAFHDLRTRNSSNKTTTTNCQHHSNQSHHSCSGAVPSSRPQSIMKRPRPENNGSQPAQNGWPPPSMQPPQVPMYPGPFPPSLFMQQHPTQQGYPVQHTQSPMHYPPQSIPHPNISYGQFTSQPNAPSSFMAMKQPQTMPPTTTGYEPAFTGPAMATRDDPGTQPLFMQNSAEIPKIKCSICGRNRSPRYQWKHRLGPGQIPGPNVCRNCRDEATDSEDGSDEFEDERRHRKDRARSQSQARSRSRSRSIGRVRTRGSSRRQSRAGYSNRSRRTVDYRSDDYHSETSTSSSDSSHGREGRTERPRGNRSRRYGHDEQDRHTRRRSRAREVLLVHAEPARSISIADGIEGHADIQYIPASR